MRVAAVALLFTLVPSLYAAGLRFDPAAPDSNSFVRVTVGGYANSCIGLFFLTSTLARLPARDAATVAITLDGYAPDSRVWAMVSITNNDTRQVAIIAPRQGGEVARTERP